MIKKKLITVGMWLTLSVMLLTGCKGGNSDTTSTGGQEQIDQITEVAGPEPAFSAESGFYDEAFELEITSGSPGAKIYYTLDGSVPDETDILYEEPITIYNKTNDKNVLSSITGVNPSGDFIPAFRVNKCNVVRAVAVLEDGTKTEVTSASYFVGIDREEKYGDVPVISIMTEPDNLFDYETGIYVLGKAYDEWLKESDNPWIDGWQREGNYSQKGREWEREATVEYITADGSEGFVQDAGIRIMGAASRAATQKSFRITSREEYEAKTFEYELIPDNLRSDGTGNVEKYKSFILRNGGNDSEYARIRDPYLQSLVKNRAFETMQSTPVVVYLNGEYWGAYTLAEDYNDNYIKHNYGLDNDNVLVVKKGELEDGYEEDMYLYDEMFDFIVDNDMSDPENYAKACELIDMENFTQYAAFNLYVYNKDTFFHGNNYSMWRCVEPVDSSPVGDGKWRMLLYDTEFSTGIYENGNGYKTDNISEIINKGIDWNWKKNPNNLFVSLLKNEDFRKELILVLCDMRNVDFEENRAVDCLTEMAEDYRVIIPETWERVGPQWLLWGDMNEYFDTRIGELAMFMTGRYYCFIDIVQDAFELSDSVTVTVENEDTTSGSVKINTTSLEGISSMTGEYFTEYPITLTATPAEGKTFVGWECKNCFIEDNMAETIEVELTGDCTIKAVFK